MEHPRPSRAVSLHVPVAAPPGGVGFGDAPRDSGNHCPGRPCFTIVMLIVHGNNDRNIRSFPRAR